MSRKIAVIGAGPGGLTAAMLLAHTGYSVKVFEEEDRVGGRSAAITGKGFSFDTGPTFLMMTFILREMFQATYDRLVEEKVIDSEFDVSEAYTTQFLEEIYRRPFPD